MGHSKKLATGTVVLLALTACGDGEPEPTPTVTVTETVEASAPEPDSASNPEDEWLEEIWDEHIDGIIDWWAEYHHVDECTPERTGCFDSFEAGYELMADYRDVINDNDSRRPGYVDGDYQAEVTLAVWEFSLWRVDCSIGGDECSERAASAHNAVDDVMSESIGWYD